MNMVDCILLIDDNVHDNFIHTRTINKIPAAKEVKTVTTGEEALEYLRLSKEHTEKYPVPNLIFLDINMPGMNGFDFLERARQEGLFENSAPILVVMLTSSLNSDDQKMASEQFSHEIKDFKNKPLTTEMLTDLLKKYF
ncbi:response regulator [Fulvivirga ulvae]|uniref:response regulator n=1 Tax=Fulvivirga ulvae TaxID=2904245 RepID=UPI001F16AA45|nr:response regulator [Fulvivirga ulvae]UII32752.1 response regulator [Fulvivirga ulvae]